jgi:inorganic pyrophosphatase
MPVGASWIDAGAQSLRSNENDMTNLIRLPHQLDSEALTCRAIIETPRGHRSKFDYDPETGLFELSGVLPASMAFPLSFGFVPGTRAQDGDPVDILVLADEDLPVGTLVTVRLLGVIEAEQTEEGETCRNDRLIGKVAQSHTYRDINRLEPLGSAFTDDLALFFQTYNKLRGRGFEVVATSDAQRATQLITEAQLVD